MNNYNVKPQFKGYTIEINLPKDKYDGYSAECTYRYDKKEQKYALSMWIKRNDLDEKFKIESEKIDTQYISGTKETIVNNICRVVEQMAISNRFDEYVERFEYTIRCFEIGCEALDE